MISISINHETECDIPDQTIVDCVKSVFEEHGVRDNAEASVSIVDRAQMLEYVKVHLKEEGAEAAAHPVLSFVQNEMEGPFEFPPDGVKHFGEIIVSLPHAQDIAKLENKTVTESLCDLVAHASLHLLGVHHD